MPRDPRVRLRHRLTGLRLSRRYSMPEQERDCRDCREAEDILSPHEPSLRATPTIKGAEQGVNATIVPASAEKRGKHAVLMLVGLLSEPTDPFKEKVGLLCPP